MHECIVCTRPIIEGPLMSSKEMFISFIFRNISIYFL